MDFGQKVEAELAEARQCLEKTQTSLWALERSQTPPGSNNRTAWLEAQKVQAIERIRIAVSKPARLRCIACKDRFESPDLAVAPCTHTYCKACAARFFNVSFEGGAIFPAKCCGYTFDINNQINKDILGVDLARRYLDKKAEVEDPDRTYCAKPTCSTWIRPDTITDNVGTCSKPECLTVTCSLCKTAAHDGSACRKDEVRELFLQTAKEQKWQTCPGCKAIVEWRSDSPFTTACLCNTDFCYLCGVEFPDGEKVCGCPYSREETGYSD